MIYTFQSQLANYFKATGVKNYRQDEVEYYIINKSLWFYLAWQMSAYRDCWSDQDWFMNDWADLVMSDGILQLN